MQPKGRLCPFLATMTIALALIGGILWALISIVLYAEQRLWQ